jgi:RNA polymerase sigma-70 factor (ECF subfamily)
MGLVRPRSAPRRAFARSLVFARPFAILRATAVTDQDSSLTAAPIDALIERCLAGDQQAWEAIVQQHRRRVFNVAYKFVGKHDEAEDLTQDIFLKLFKSLDTFDRRANFQTWLISVSRNLCIDHYRRVRKERETVDRDVDAGELTPASGDLSPFVVLERSDRRELLRRGLDGLAPTLRSAVMLRDIHELSYQEIADRLGVPEGTVKSRINRGRLELARQIRKVQESGGVPRERVGTVRRDGERA